VGTVNEFIQFIRRNSHRESSFSAIVLQSSPSKPCSLRRFSTRLIINFDETPLPFEFLEGYTYDIRGTKTIAGKSERSGWGKSQATIILYIMANGDTPLTPVVIFHGKGIVASRENYDSRVDVHFNETAYNNEELFSQWLKDVYIPYADGDNSMMVMDVAIFHRTEGILDLLNSNNILPAMIPPGLISLLQPLDTAINDPFKKKQLQIQSEAYLDWLEETGGISDKWTIRHRRKWPLLW
jgi:hypothetical protein